MKMMMLITSKQLVWLQGSCGTSRTSTDQADSGSRNCSTLGERKYLIRKAPKKMVYMEYMPDDGQSCTETVAFYNTLGWPLSKADRGPTKTLSSFIQDLQRSSLVNPPASPRAGTKPWMVFLGLWNEILKYYMIVWRYLSGCSGLTPFRQTTWKQC